MMATKKAGYQINKKPKRQTVRVPSSTSKVNPSKAKGKTRGQAGAPKC